MPMTRKICIASGDGWLQLYNACQFLPGMLLTTSAGLDGRDYEVLGTGYPTMSQRRDNQP